MLIKWIEENLGRPKAPIPPFRVVKADPFKGCQPFGPTSDILDNCPVCNIELVSLGRGLDQQSIVVSHLIVCLKEYVDANRGHSGETQDLEG